MVMPGLSEAEEAEAFTRDLGNGDLRSHKLVAQVIVVSTVDFRPRGPVI